MTECGFSGRSFESKWGMVTVLILLHLGGLQSAHSQISHHQWFAGQVASQGSTQGVAPSGSVVTIVAPPPAPLDAPNSAGWNTGYSAITSSYERPNPIGQAFGGSDTIRETASRIVPNDVLGQPIRGGVAYGSEPNSAGWSTGYSVVTQTYERADPLGHALGGARTVTETRTRVVPNDALGAPMAGAFWP